MKGFSIVCFSVPEYISKASPNYCYTLTSAQNEFREKLFISALLFRYMT